ncbi:protein kinase [Streptomyces kunmingensis]|uniref:non-specific serine/threonine protein kinase n=1 Tax=Streptomyces kunmingensis TaxID=68225 RepID=A0ABU6CCJ5_9ACTN|nr:protein kinase [Streptomyces kunmingensis]MEB3962444.1 protein kinase [Streptomyces kunmingensis]
MSGGVRGLVVSARYRLDEHIGQGGMGRVWRAVDEILDRPVAVKEMRIDGLDPEDARTRRERTLREARATARIDHPNVVRVYDVVDEGERLWIVMELVDGRSLEQVLVEDGPLGVDAVAGIGRGLAEALRPVHGGGVLHRDIKPGNVMLERAGRRRVMLTDFGIAAIQDTTALTMVGMLVGSPDYMAPERVAGRPQGPPSDLWSLGTTLCAALGGRSPFSRDTTLATLHAVLYEEPQLPPEADWLTPLLTRLLAKEPEDRPDLDAILEALARPAPTPAPAPVPNQHPRTPTLDIGLHRPPAHPPEPADAPPQRPAATPPSTPPAAPPSSTPPRATPSSTPPRATPPSTPPRVTSSSTPPRATPPVLPSVVAPSEGPTRIPSGRASASPSERAPASPGERAPASPGERASGSTSRSRSVGRSEGWTEGRSEGRTEGRSEGRSEGLSKSPPGGLSEGREEGREEDRAGGWPEGRYGGRAKSSSEGRTRSPSEGRAQSSSEGRTQSSSEGRTQSSSEGWPKSSSEGRTQSSSEGRPKSSSGSRPNGSFGSFERRSEYVSETPAGRPSAIPSEAPTEPSAPRGNDLLGPPAPAAGPRPKRRRVTLLAAGGALAAGLAVALALTLPGNDSPGGAPTATSRPPTVEGTSRPPATEQTLPPGSRREAGYAWVPPKGWERVVKTASEVHYTSPDGTQELVAQSALAKDDLLATWKKAERDAHQGQDYEKIRLGRTTFRGRPAVVWEYLFTLKGARWHAELLGFEQGTQSYQIGTWYQPQTETRARKTYEQVKKTFTVLQRSPSGTN